MGSSEIVIQIQTGRVRVDEKGDIIEDHPKLREDPLGQGEVPSLVAFGNDIEITHSPKRERLREADEKDHSDGREERLLPSGTEIEILEKVELVEGDEEGKDGHVLLSEEAQEITQYRPGPEEGPFLFRREPPLDVEDHSQEVEHAGHGSHPLDDVGDGLGLEGVDKEDEILQKRAIGKAIDP